MSKELIENLRDYADIAEAGEKSHWALAMREAAEYIRADLEANEHEAYGKVRYIDRIARRAVFSFSTDLNGNIPKWLKEGAKVYTRPQVEKPMTEEEFLNLKLPCDIKIGNGKNGKGTSIKTLLLRANSIYKAVMALKNKSLDHKIFMTSIRPTKPGWYWYELPGSWPLQPVYVFNAGDDIGLLYKIDAIFSDECDDYRDGFEMKECHKNALWSNLPITEPDTKAEIKLIPDEEISDFCSDMPEELKSIFKMGVRFAEDRIHGIKGRE